MDNACRPLPPGAPPVRVVLAGGGPGTRLAVEVVCAELRRRLPAADIRPLDPGDGPDPFAGTASGPPGVVVSDAASVERARERPTGDDLIVLGAAGGRLPTPTLLADRAWDPTVLDGRADRLRLSRALPPTGRILLGALLADPPVDDDRLAGLATAEGLELVRLGPDVVGPTDRGADPAARRVAPDDPLDLAAACTAAGVVVADDPHLAGLALALGRPTVALASGGGDAYGWPAGAVVVDDVGRVAGALGPARGRAADPAERDPARQRLDDALDAVAADIRGLVADRPAPEAADLVRRIAVLEALQRGLEARLHAERLAFGASAAAQLHPPREDDRQRLWAQRQAAQAAEADAWLEVEAAQREAAVIGGALQAAAAAIGARDAELTRRSTAHSAALAELGSLRPQLTDGRAALLRVTVERDEARSAAERASAELARVQALPGQSLLRLLQRVLTGLRAPEG